MGRNLGIVQQLGRLGDPLRSQRGVLLSWSIAVIIVILARMTGMLQPLEWLAFDTLLRLRPGEPTDPRLLVVGIDEDDIRQAGTYPVPDRDIARLIETLQQQQPAVIGLDIFRDLAVEPGHADLVRVFEASQSSKNLIGIERVLGDASDAVNLPPSLLAEQVGFADAIADTDGQLRRSLLGTHDYRGDYKFSFTIRLAARYLERQGFSLEMGIRDSMNMRFGSIELPHLQPNSGGYVGGDTGGNQILLNFRSGPQPFQVVSMGDVLDGKIPADQIRDRIVLIGMTAPSVGDVVYTNAINSNHLGFIFGVEVQAHAISQIISAVLDGRPLLQVWSEGWEYLWIVGWGVVAIGLTYGFRSPLKVLIAVTGASVGLVGVSYGLLILSDWSPLVPALLTLWTGTVALLGARYDQNLKRQIRDREKIIEQTFDAIHSGPLQIVSTLSRELQENTTAIGVLKSQVDQLDEELRAIHGFMRDQFMATEADIDPTLDGNLFSLNRSLTLNLENPISELLYEVFDTTLQRDLPGFRTIKLKIQNFIDVDTHSLTLTQKRGLCIFLEGALCNVGKHAIGATELEVHYGIEADHYHFRVIDNGQNQTESSVANLSTQRSIHRGTQQAQQVARLFKGEFQRRSHQPQGMICELIWPIKSQKSRLPRTRHRFSRRVR